MPVDKELLSILCCPKTKVDIQELIKQDLDKLNSKINDGTIHYADGKVVEEPLSEGLVTVDLQTVYRVDDGIPVMLIDMGIPYKQIQ
ncbi:MAG: Trm112 family protein [Calditrichae bacterium]|nr:Trm112 family protein [Calditrichota bacterium]MCB9057293.1 Trm112 family protein [Calditrichia bacterium]